MNKGLISVKSFNIQLERTIESRNKIREEIENLEKKMQAQEENFRKRIF